MHALKAIKELKKGTIVGAGDLSLVRKETLNLLTSFKHSHEKHSLSHICTYTIKETIRVH